MKKKTQWRRKSILTKMLTSMLLSLVVMFLLLGGTIFGGGVTAQLRTNAFDILDERVSGRRDNLVGEMVQRWSNLGESVQFINGQAARILQEENAGYADFHASSPLSGELLNAVSERLIDQLRRSSVTGIFLILNGEESASLPKGEETQSRAGIYLRDYDPDTSPADNSDFMLERAPMAFVKEQDITLDTYWQPVFTFRAEEKNDFFFAPYRAAIVSPGALAEDLGYWGSPELLDPSGTSALTYSLPLLSADGTPYGVLGVELTLDYLAKKLPYSEINGNIQGSYVLAKKQKDSNQYEKLLSTGPYFKNLFGSECSSLTLSENAFFGNSYQLISEGTEKIYGCVQPLALYNTNTPFENEQWALIGVIEDSSLLRLHHSVLLFLLLSLLLAFLIGVVSIVLTSLRLARPITQLAGEVRTSDPNRPVSLGKIDIAEIDELSAAIEMLSQSVADSYSTLSKIMAMVGYRVGAFEYNSIRSEVRYTNDFFSVLGLPTPADAQEPLAVTAFHKLLLPLYDYPAERQGNNTVYHLPEADGKDIWVRMQVVESAEKTLGVVSDVTAEILQRKRLEYERDYDSLTMLQNRRAFHEQVGALIAAGSVSVAAMIMIDLDNLKYINDTYGHDVGDSYLRTAADVLRRHTGDHVLTGRMSGDEFYVFIRGNDHAEVEKTISILEQDLRAARLTFPDGAVTRMRVSAGIAWYPEDSKLFDQLIRFADFAMYRVKHTTKGKFAEFKQENYDRESFLLNNKEELNHLIEEGLICYDFQPIVDARDGSVFAYEALMRPTLPVFASPLDVLAMAHSQSKLYEIERLTWFRALEEFSRRSPAGDKVKLFLNSIPNQILGSADLSVIRNTYGGYLSRLVVELTEEEKPDGHLTVAKTSILKSWHAQIALDDFGAGYNGEVTLLEVSPDFIKIDQSIVRNVDSDSNRRHIVESLIAYAERYHISVIGEGVETAEELQVLLACGVQYLQGFYLAYPQRELCQSSAEAVREILEFQKKK